MNARLVLRFRHWLGCDPPPYMGRHYMLFEMARAGADLSDIESGR